MPIILSKLTAILLIISGETLIILAQIFGAKTSSLANNFWQNLSPLHWYFWATVAGSFLILIGYFYGITIFRNIWLVTIISWSALVVAETILAYTVFNTIPTNNVLLGFILVLIGSFLANL